MRHDQLEQLLTLIVSYDRKPFPDGATEAWYPLLYDVEYGDAERAVHDYYGAPGARDDRGNIRQIMPGDIRSGARRIRDLRHRAAARQAITSPPPRRGSTGRPASVEALLAGARRKVAADVARYRAKVQAA